MNKSHVSNLSKNDSKNKLNTQNKKKVVSLEYVC